MLKNQYSFSEFKFSSQIIRDLIEEKDGVKPFINDFFSESAILKQANIKPFSEVKRLQLFNALTNQYKGIDLSDKSQANLEALKDKSTFTITTGHQLNLLTGPLYSIYKILQVIVWSEKFNKTQSKIKFVPVFWMATEDHDFEEINHINLFGSKIEWNKEGQEDFISGKIELKDFDTFKTQVEEKFSDENLKQKLSRYLKHYNGDLAQSSRSLINELFGEYGLLILDGDDTQLKSSFKNIAKQEIENKVTFTEVSKTNQALIDSGYHNQVYLRVCNLFYIENGKTRYRIDREGDEFEINGKNYTKSELLEMLEKSPQSFSPNALLRPVYQESVLPNVCYIGGGGEIAYWLQIKNIFGTLNIDYPILRVRDSYLILNQKQIDSINEVGFSVLDLKKHIDELAKLYVQLNAEEKLSLEKVYTHFQNLKSELESKVARKDLGVQRFVEGELVRMQNQLEKIEKKLIQNEKKNQENGLKKLRRIQSLIYPNNGFQERYENILQYLHIDNVIDDIKKEVEQSIAVQPQISIIKV